MTFEILAKIVADDFLDTMKEFEFDTFEEMANCYYWDSKDIKEEVDAIIRAKTNDVAYINEWDGNTIHIGDEMMDYRKFARMWRKYLK